MAVKAKSAGKAKSNQNEIEITVDKEAVRIFPLKKNLSSKRPKVEVTGITFVPKGTGKSEIFLDLNLRVTIKSKKPGEPG